VLVEYQTVTGEKLSITRFCRGTLSAFAEALSKEKDLSKVADVWFPPPNRRAQERNKGAS